MDGGVTISNGFSIILFSTPTFFISGFTLGAFAIQTGLPVSGVSIEMDWDL